jgi:putative hydrolase of the HAD superfamily
LSEHHLDRERFEESSRKLDRGHISDNEFYKQLAALSGHSVDSIRLAFDEKLIDKTVVSLMQVLRSHYKIALLSNASGTYLRPILEKHGLMPLFDEIAISAEVGLIKPEPAVFKHILKQLGVQAGEAIFIDDSPTNVQAAEALGIRSFVFAGTEALRKELAAAGIKVS